MGRSGDRTASGLPSGACEHLRRRGQGVGHARSNGHARSASGSGSGLGRVEDGEGDVECVDDHGRRGSREEDRRFSHGWRGSGCHVHRPGAAAGTRWRTAVGAVVALLRILGASFGKGRRAIVGTAAARVRFPRGGRGQGRCSNRGAPCLASGGGCTGSGHQNHRHKEQRTEARQRLLRGSSGHGHEDSTRQNGHGSTNDGRSRGGVAGYLSEASAASKLTQQPSGQMVAAYMRETMAALSNGNPYSHRRLPE